MAMTKEEMAEAVRRRQAKKFPFTPEQYLDMKADGLSDAKIMQKYELNGVKLNQWKHEHNLIRKDTTKAPAAKPVKLDEETKSRLSGLKDKLNTPKAAQEPQDEPEVQEMTVSAKKEEDPVSVDYEKFCETKEKEIFRLTTANEKLTAKNAELAAENEKLYQAKPAEPDLSVVEELKAENARLRAVADQLELAQSDVYKLVEEVRELEPYKAEYHKLEKKHAEIRALLHPVEEENAALTGTETEHIQLMRRHVQLYDRMQGVYGG